MEFHRPRPRFAIESRFWVVGWRDGLVDSFFVTSSGRLAWKALRQLIVRGMPLKLMHLRPTSRMNSAVRVSDPACCEEATLCRTDSESGELSVNVAAACVGRPG